MNQMANQIPAPGDAPLHPSLVTGDGEKRPAPSTPSTATSSLPKAKSAKMSKQDLVDKFRLAAELNGIEWGDIAESSLHMFKKFDKFLHFGVPWFTNKFKLTV